MVHDADETGDRSVFKGDVTTGTVSETPAKVPETEESSDSDEEVPLYFMFYALVLN